MSDDYVSDDCDSVEKDFSRGGVKIIVDVSRYELGAHMVKEPAWIMLIEEKSGYKESVFSEFHNIANNIYNILREWVRNGVNVCELRLATDYDRKKEGREFLGKRWMGRRD